MRFKTKHQPKSTRTQKAEFILRHFPEVLTIKRIRTDVDKVTKIKHAMFEHGLYSKTYDSASPASDSAIIKIIEFLQDKHLASNKIVDQKSI